MSDIHDKEFDVVIVGAGISGGIIAKELGKQCKGLDILILESGTGSGFEFEGYEVYNDQFYNATIKVPNSPYTDTPFSPSPSVLDPTQIKGDDPDTNGYFVQYGPFPFLSNYNRNEGGTTLHWLGTTLRMCPNDFNMQKEYGVALNWPLKYPEMQPYYRRAEHEIGVAGSVKAQTILDITFDKNYVYPMHEIPQSYLDLYLRKKLGNDFTIEFDGKPYPVQVIQTPQGRNGMPNKKYVNLETGKKGFTPQGAVGAPDLGQRCEGNSNCVPICPVQAKYNAIKTLYDAVHNRRNNVRIVNQCAVSSVDFNKKTGRITQVNYKSYQFSADGSRTSIQSYSVKGKVVVLAANAIENAKILLASDACTRSDQVGRNLMDHLCTLSWGYLPDDIGAYRGPGSTSGMPLTRDGDFRKTRSAFRIEIGNWGWNWPANTPESTVQNAVKDGFFGKELIKRIKDETSRQFRIAWEVEQLPNPNNRVTIMDEYRDELGNYRPVIHYELTDFEKRGAKAAKKLNDAVFEQWGVDDQTVVDDTMPGYFEYEKEGYVFQGAGHVVGCHRMGTDPLTSVVDTHQRAHDHRNLFVVGCGSMPTLATSNPTLTMAALAMRSADAIAKEFNKKTGKKPGGKKGGFSPKITPKTGAKS